MNLVSSSKWDQAYLILLFLQCNVLNFASRHSFSSPFSPRLLSPPVLVASAFCWYCATLPCHSEWFCPITRNEAKFRFGSSSADSDLCFLRCQPPLIFYSASSPALLHPSLLLQNWKCKQRKIATVPRTEACRRLGYWSWRCSWGSGSGSGSGSGASWLSTYKKV